MSTENAKLNFKPHKVKEYKKIINFESIFFYRNPLKAHAFNSMPFF